MTIVPVFVMKRVSHVSVIDALIEERLLWPCGKHINGFHARHDVPTIVPLNAPSFVVRQGVVLHETIADSFQAVQEQEETKLTTVDNTIDELERGIARLEREYSVTFDMMSDKEIRENRASKARLMKRLDDVKKRQEREAQRGTRQTRSSVSASFRNHTRAMGKSGEKRKEAERKNASLFGSLRMTSFLKK